MIIKLTIDRFEADQAILKTEDGTTILWPKKKLPAYASESANLLFAISDNPNENADNRNLAKNILNDIINPEKE